MTQHDCPEDGCLRSFLTDTAALDDHVVAVHGYQDYAMAAKARAKAQAAGVTVSKDDPSFPIPDVQHLMKAIRAFGRAPKAKQATVKAHIIARAKALGATKMLPQGWS